MHSSRFLGAPNPGCCRTRVPPPKANGGKWKSNKRLAKTTRLHSRRRILTNNIVLTPADLPPTVTTLQENGGTDWKLDPVPLFMFSPPASASSIAQIAVNDIRAICKETDGSNCAFEYDAAKTPVVESVVCLDTSTGDACKNDAGPGVDDATAVQIRAGDRFELTGLNFIPADVEQGSNKDSGTLTIMFGATACNVVSSTDTKAECVVADGTSGPSPLKLTSGSYGVAVEAQATTPVAGNLLGRFFAYAGRVDSVTEKDAASNAATSAPVTGGNVLVIAGTGFAPLRLVESSSGGSVNSSATDNYVTIGYTASSILQKCKVIAATYTSLECIVPPAPGLASSTTYADEAFPISGSAAVRFGLVSGDATVGSVEYKWERTKQIAAMHPTRLSAGVTTTITMEGDFAGDISGGGDIAETADCKHTFHVETATTSRLCKSLVVNATHASCTLPRGPAPPIAEQPSARPVLRLCASSGVSTFAHYAGTLDYALRIESVTPNVGSIAGGTVLTVTGAGFADVSETMVVTGFTRQREVGSNDAGILTAHRRVPCRIISASFDVITCISARFEAGTLTSSGGEAPGHGHSGGGINGRFDLRVNDLAVLGVLHDDPDGSHDVFHAEGNTTGIVAEAGNSLAGTSAVVELPPAELLLQLGNAAQWIDFYRNGAEVCMNEQLSNAAQAYAEELRDTFGSAQSDIFGGAAPPHVGVDGSTTGSRVTSQGYEWEVLGEAIAYVPSNSGAAAVRAWQIDGIDRTFEVHPLGSVQPPTDAWSLFDMNDAEFTEFGIGLAGGYFVAVFGKPTGDACTGDSASFGQRRRRMMIPLANAANEARMQTLHEMAEAARSTATFDFNAAELVASAAGKLPMHASILGLELELNVVDATRQIIDVDSGYFPASFRNHRWYTGSIVGWKNAHISLGIRANGEVHGTIQLPKSTGGNAAVIEINTNDNSGVTQAVLSVGPPEAISMADGHGHVDVRVDRKMDANSSSSNATRARRQNANTCKVFVDADKWFFQQWGGSGSEEQRVEKTILTMLDSMIAAQQVFYHNFGVDGGPYLYVVGAAVHTGKGFGEADPAQLQNHEAVLSEYSAYLSADNAAAVGTNRHRSANHPKGDDVCLNHLFTHANFGQVVGLANLGTACNTDFSNTAFTSTRSANGRMSLAGRQATTIHEIGHNFNAPHDCSDESATMCEAFLAEADTPDIEDECLDTGDNYLMWPSVTYGVNAAQFSPCSRALILQKAAQLDCLIPNPVDMDWYAFIPTLGPLRDPDATTAAPTTTQPRMYHEYQDDAATFMGEFDFVEAATPHLDSINPLSGNGQVRVTITGSGLQTTEWVEVGGQACSGLNVASDSTLECNVPVLAAGRYHVRVKTLSGFAAHPLLHEQEVAYIALLTLTDVTPPTGSRAGGTLVTLVGSGFGTSIAGCTVRFGGSTAVVVAVQDDAVQLVTTASSLSGDDVDRVSVQISIQTDQSGPEDYGQLLERRRTSGRVALPANCLTCSHDSFATQVSGRINTDTQEIWTPSWFTIMSSSCNASYIDVANVQESCSFRYLDAQTPQVTAISPTTGLATTVVTVSGSGFGASLSAIGVFIGNAPCVVTAVSESAVECTVGESIAGVHTPYVTVSGKGVAAVATNVVFEAAGGVSALDFDGGSNGGSSGGGNTVTLAGHGFGQDAAETAVDFCGSPCAVTASSYNELTCTTSGLDTPLSLFRFGNKEHGSLRRAEDPMLASFNDPGAAAGAENAPFDQSYQTEYSSSATGECFAGLDASPGRLMLLTVVRFFPVGFVQQDGDVYATPGGFTMQGGWIEASNSTEGPWTVLADIAAPHQGWNALDMSAQIPAQYVRYRGPAASNCELIHLDFIGVVARASSECTAVVHTQSSVTHPSLGSDATSPSATFESSTAVTYTYNDEVTPLITSVEPWFGSSLGGTTVTIHGERLPTDPANAAVTVNGRPCTDVVAYTVNDINTLECVTSQRTEFVPPSVTVTYTATTATGSYSGSSVHAHTLKLFRYLDRWSESNTWLNDEPPGYGDSILVPLDQTLIMDVTPPSHLRVILVQGVFVFDDFDVELHAEYIFVQGGRFEVGTEDYPFQNKATITLHGSEEDSIGLPVIGGKVLAVMGAPGAGSSVFGGGASASRRDIGEVDLHGQALVTWTKVDSTVHIGDNEIQVADSVHACNAGDRIIVSGPAEEFVVESVSEDGLTITVTAPAVLEHISEIKAVTDADGNSDTFEMQCELGVLTRNVVVQGAAGESGGEFGAHVIATASSEFRSSFTEYRNCGQAGRSRHCIHLHHLGSVRNGESFLLGNSIHHSYNRGIVLTSTSGVDVLSNVAYKVEGHAYHQGDAESIYNVFGSNLGVLTTKTLACGRSDCKPATFTVASPQNYWRFNVAADSMKNGFGWAMRPMSPESYLPVNEFYANTAHHCEVGLFIKVPYMPVQPVEMYNNSFYKNAISGVFHKATGDVHHVHSKFGMNGGVDFLWMGYVYGAPGTRFNPSIRDSIFVGNLGSSVGLFGPKGEYFFVSGLSFDNYGANAPAIKGCAACCCVHGVKQGAYTYRYERLAFSDTTPVRVGWACPYKQIHYDLDGTLTGHVNGSVTAYKEFNDWSNDCTVSEVQFSNGIVCNSSVRIRRLAITGVDPEEIDGQPLWLKKSKQEADVDGEMVEVYGGTEWDSFATTRTLFTGACRSTETHGYLRDTAKNKYCWTRAGYGSGCAFPDTQWKWKEDSVYGESGHYSATSSSVMVCKWDSLGVVSNNHPVGANSLFRFQALPDGTTRIFQEVGPSTGLKALSQGGCGARRELDPDDLGYWYPETREGRDGFGTIVYRTCTQPPLYNTRGRQQLTACDPTGAANEIFEIETIEAGATTRDSSIIIIRSTIDGTYLGGPDNIFGGSYMFGFSRDDAVRFENTPGGVAGTDGCTDQAHLDHVTFRDAADGYGWSAAVVTDRDYFVDFGGVIDFQTMTVQWSNPFYHEHYGAGDETESVLLKFPYVDYRYRFEVQHAGLGGVEVPWYDRYSKYCIGDFCPVLGDDVPPLTRVSPVFGTGYMKREDESLATTGSFGEWLLALNPNGNNVNTVELDVYASDRFKINVEAKQCAPLMNCFGPNPALGDGSVWLWSNASLWEEIYAIRRFLSDPAANPTGTFPAEGEHVEIPSGFTVILDVTPENLPKLGRLTISGTLVFQDTADRSLHADTILVWGALQVGTADAPFQNNAEIVLHGTRTSDVLVASEKHFLGNKVMVVFGSALLYGTSRGQHKAKLAATANVGDDTITLASDVDWQAGDVVVLAPTGTNVYAIETATIATVTLGNTLTLEAPLQYAHSVSSTLLPNGKVVQLAADVGMLTGHSIRISANDPSQAEDVDKEWGMHVVVGEHSYSGGDSSARHLGKLIATGVEFNQCGKSESEHPCIMMRYFSGISEQYSVFDWFYTAIDQPTNRITSSSFRNTLNGALATQRTFGLLFEMNVVHKSRRNAVSLDHMSEGASIRNNLFVGNYRSPDEVHIAVCLADSSCTVKPFAAIYAEAVVHAVSGNTIAGAEDTGIAVRWGDESCTDAGNSASSNSDLWSGNEIYVGMVGLRLLPVPGILASVKCLTVHGVTVWKTTDVGIMTVDQKANVHLDNVVLSDNHVGVALNFIRSGSDNVVKVHNSSILGSTTASTCDAADVEGACRTYGQSNTIATFCSSLFGGGVRRVGLALPRYTNKEQTCGASGSKEVCRPLTRPIKQCAVPWLARFGRVQATRAELHVTDTTFYGFKTYDCGKSGHAMAPLPDEPDLLPDITLSRMTWANTDARAKFSLGYGDASSHLKCSSLCDAHQAATITDTDGTSIGHNPGSTSDSNGDGSVVLLSERAPGLAESALCRYDISTRTNICKAFAVAHVVLSSSKGIGPIVISRNPSVAGASGFEESQQYSSIGNTDEKACSGESKNARYPFKIVVADGVVHRIRPSNPTPNNARLDWHAPAQNAAALVEVVFADVYAEMVLFVDAKSMADKEFVEVDGVKHTPDVDSEVGSWSYYASTKTLTMVLHGSKTRYEWLGALNMEITIGMAATIDVPQDAGIEVKNSAAAAFAESMALSLSETLGIPLSQWRVVCVHPVGEPCTSRQRRRLQPRLVADDAIGGGGGSKRRSTVSLPYTLKYELTPPNNGSAFDEAGAKTPAYAENLAFATDAVFALKWALSFSSGSQIVTMAEDAGTSSGDDVAAASMLSFSFDSPSTGDTLQTEAGADEFGRQSLLPKITLTGSAFHDVDADSVFDANIDSTLANLEVTVTDSDGSTVATTSTDADGAWSVPSLVPAVYLVGIGVSDLPPTSLEWKSIGDPIINQVDGNYTLVASTAATNADGGSDAEARLHTVHRFQTWGAVTGTVVEGTGADGDQVGAGLQGVLVGVTDATGTPRTAVTDAAGQWSVDAPAGSVTIDVDERTLPFSQPYIGLPTSSNDPLEHVVMGASIQTVYRRFVVVYGHVYAQATSTAASEPLYGLQLIITGSDGLERSVATDDDGKWAIPLPPGTATVEVQPASLPAPSTCLLVGSGQVASMDVVVPISAGESDAGMEVAAWTYDCINQCEGICGVVAGCVDGVHDATCAATCNDGLLNGNEVDVDCGGSDCPTCLSPTPPPTPPPACCLTCQTCKFRGFRRMVP